MVRPRPSTLVNVAKPYRTVRAKNRTTDVVGNCAWYGVLRNHARTCNATNLWSRAVYISKPHCAIRPSNEQVWICSSWQSVFGNCPSSRYLSNLSASFNKPKITVWSVNNPVRRIAVGTGVNVRRTSRNGYSVNAVVVRIRKPHPAVRPCGNAREVDVRVVCTYGSRRSGRWI